jgi:hypothetical protein
VVPRVLLARGSGSRARHVIATSSRCRLRHGGGATIGRRAARCRGQRRLRRGVDQRRAVRSSARSLLSRPSVGRRLLRRTTCGLTATRARACRPGRIPAGPRSQPPRAYPRSRLPRAPHETEKRRGLRSEHRGERRRWATGGPTPETPTLPKDRNSSPKDQRSPWQVAAAEPATAHLTGRCAGIGLGLPLTLVSGVGNESHTRVGRESGRSESHQPNPRNVAGHDPAGRRKV